MQALGSNALSFSVQKTRFEVPHGFRGDSGNLWVRNRVEDARGLSTDFGTINFLYVCFNCKQSSIPRPISQRSRIHNKRIYLIFICSFFSKRVRTSIRHVAAG